jgi:PPOX class probable F420-dependent enzyme
MARMTDDEARAFCAEGARTATVATVRPDGRPHATPVWYGLDGEDCVFTTWHSTVKARNLQANPAVCLIVENPNPPFDYVMVDGRAEFIDGAGELVRWATEIGGKYMGAEQAEAFGRRNGVEGELLVRVHPTKIVGIERVADF